METYRIHPGVGIARLGNAPEEFCIAAEQPAALPLEVDAEGNSLPRGAPLGAERRVERLKDPEGRIKRQAARFGVWVYDDENPDGRPLKVGDAVSGGGNRGTLVDIQWRVHLANKKASWFEFRQLEGEHGYAPDHPRRNAHVTAPGARQRLIVDPGPRVVDLGTRRRAEFTREGGGEYAATFPPPLEPHSIDTLGELRTDDDGRLLVLGGFGNAGSYLYDELGQPRIDEYANNDGWFDDTADGPVMARLVFFSEEVQQNRFIDVEYPAWVLVGYPDYVPEIPDMITMDEVVHDLAVREFAWRTDLYGTVGTWDCPERIDPRDREALVLWQNGRVGWNPEHRPWFYRDVWPILWRPEQYFWLTSVLSKSNDPHNQTSRGTFDPARIGTPPRIDWAKVADDYRACLDAARMAELVVAPLEGVLERVLRGGGDEGRPAGGKGKAKRKGVLGAAKGDGDAAGALIDGLRGAVADFAAEREVALPADAKLLARAPSAPAPEPAPPEAQAALAERVGTLLAALPDDAPDGDAPRRHAAAAPVHNAAPEDRRPASLRERVRRLVEGQLRRLHRGDLHRECFRRCVERHTHDPYRAERQFLFALLRPPGGENQFAVGEFALGGNADSRIHNLPMMPLLAGDNPISNTLTSKFLRLTDLQYYLLRQWAEGKFVNEYDERWVPEPDVNDPFPLEPITSGLQLDRGVLSHVLGGAFCPGGEVGWILRNPAVWREPYRVKADPAFSQFTLTAAQANAWRGRTPETDYISYEDLQLSQDDDLDTGMQPGDLTKHSALPWQADFNECSTQVIDVTYAGWNVLYPDNPPDALLARQQKQWETLWWPAHRPMQTYELIAVTPDGKPTYQWLDWSRGVTQTVAGDQKMVIEWPRLAFVVRNPRDDPDHAFIGVERSRPSR